MAERLAAPFRDPKAGNSATASVDPAAAGQGGLTLSLGEASYELDGPLTCD